VGESVAELVEGGASKIGDVIVRGLGRPAVLRGDPDHGVGDLAGGPRHRPAQVLVRIEYLDAALGEQAS
jgi:hypothetical protein